MNNYKYRLIDPKTEESYFKFLIGSGFVLAFSFGLYYYFLEIMILVHVCAITFACFGVLFLLFLRNFPLTLLFRLDLTVTFVAFYLQVLYTGAIYSPSLTIFVTFPLFGFFYRPKIDRFIFGVVAFLTIISMWFWSDLGFVANLIPPHFYSINNLVASLILLGIVTVFSMMFWTSIRQKNKKLINSLNQLESTTNKLVQSEKMASLGILSAGIAHEINNPLNFIKGGIFQIQEQLKALNVSLSTDTQKSIDLLDEGVQRVTTIVKSLNHFSRTNETSTVWCNVHDIMDNCLIMLHHRISKHITITKNYGEHIPALMANEGKLHQVFLNILTNAIQAIDDVGEITITTTYREAGVLIISVKDTGEGIADEHLDKVTDPFFTTKNPGEGTGLGLYICYNLMHEQNGELKIESKLGKGTKITTSFNIHQ